MPKQLSTDASAVYAAIIAKQGMTQRVRTLRESVAEYCDSTEALDWADDLQSLGFAIPSDEKQREDFAKSLGTAFAAVATEVSGRKRGARVSILDTADGTEVAVAFREVKQRDKS